MAQTYDLVAQADKRKADKDREGQVREHSWISKKVDQSTPTKDRKTAASWLGAAFHPEVPERTVGN